MIPARESRLLFAVLTCLDKIYIVDCSQYMINETQATMDEESIGKGSIQLTGLNVCKPFELDCDLGDESIMNE